MTKVAKREHMEIYIQVTLSTTTESKQMCGTFLTCVLFTILIW